MLVSCWGDKVVKNKANLSRSQEGLGSPASLRTPALSCKMHRGLITWIRVNDPSAGSPTETLLRLLLPLNDQV